MEGSVNSYSQAGAEHFRIIAEASSDAIVTIDQHSTIVFANASVNRVFGYSADELVGCSLTRLMPEYLRHVHEHGLQRYLTTGKKHISWEGVELPAVHKSGRPLVVEVSFGEFDLDGKRFFTGVIRDVTERKRAETRRLIEAAVIRVLAENIATSEIPTKILQTICSNLGWKVGTLWALDPATRKLRFSAVWHEANPELARFVENERDFAFAEGIGLPGRVLQRGTPQWVDDLGTATYLPRQAITLAAGLNAGFGFPIRVSGTIVAVMEFFSTEIQEPDNELMNMLSVVGGQIGQFMERRRAEEEREALLIQEQHARLAAEEANRLKDEFLTTVSHELRTPMTAIVGWTDLLLTGQLDDKGRQRAIEIISNNALLQTRLVDDLLDLSRIVTGKVRLNVEPLYLASPAQEAIESIRPAAEAKDIRIQASLDPKAGPVSGDADRLQQVVWNLLSNAVKFTPKNGRIEVIVEMVDSHVELRVSDTGLGISPEFLPYVFDRFRQADASYTREHSGMGIGLAIVRHLVELHGGTVQVTSAGARQGSTFAVRLPIRAIYDSLDTPTGEVSWPGLSSNGSTELQKLKILVVDDDPETVNLIRTILEMRGAQVTTSTSAEEAIKLIPAVKPQILISDIGMPDADGYALIRSVRKLGHPFDQLPSLALTAYAREEDRIRALREGYDAHLAKPILAESLVAAVAALAESV